MATIKTTGTGSALRVLTKTEGGVQRVSCSCCESDEYCCVFPASCGKGPAAIFFYGDTLNETSAGSLVYGDSENGAELSGDQWIIHRNGQSRTQQCLGLGELLGVEPPSVQAILASSYAVSMTGPTVNTTLSFTGPFPTSEFIIEGAIGQCAWTGSGDGIFDEGLTIIFNKLTCRWELHNGPLNEGGLFAFLGTGFSQQSPLGSYETVGDITSVTVS